MSSLTREQARALIDEIREENGGLSPEDRNATRPSVLKALANVRRKLGAATKTLATNLYSKDTRFVYELIQNADDNDYDVAKAEGNDLFLSFSIYPDRIVIDSNEDGFREEHVRAICSTGDSTKTTTLGYIGEKGIGFKSVFKVAKKVHIQSGPFSFYFEHTRDSDDDGLGMVTPVNGDYEYLPRNVRTRMTLTLLNPSMFDQRVKDLYNIPDTILLFLNKLDEININVYPQDGTRSETRYCRLVHAAGEPEKLLKLTTTDKSAWEVLKRFHVTRREVHNLPHDKARKYTDTATIVLAFPVDVKDIPVVEQQHVFAFLPLRKAGFTFLVQSDFITQASREDVFHSARNEALLSGVAETFRDAVLQFCKHHSLQYQWMRYLPTDSISDEFWRNLRPKILSILKNTPCVQSWEKRLFYVPNKLYRLTLESKDQHDEPLFADLDNEAYLSPNYTFSDYLALESIGVSRITMGIFLKRVEYDLSRSDSRLKAATSDEDWHTRVATILSKPLETRTPSQYTIQINNLHLIPLRDERWVSKRDGLDIYFPQTDSAFIPTDLGLNLVDPDAVENAARKTLFSHLGVGPCDPSRVISLIIDVHSAQRPLNISGMASHLQYLYWHLPEENPELDGKVCLADQTRTVVYRSGPRKKYIYFDEPEEEYGPHQLLENINDNAPGISVSFLHDAILEAVPEDALNHGRTWTSWLEEIAGVKRAPQLLAVSDSGLSAEFKYIVKYRSEKLIGTLNHHWLAYEPLVSDVTSELKQSSVPSETSRMIRLEESFLPLPMFKTIISNHQITNFPFLKMPSSLRDQDKDEWKFLEKFGVSVDDKIGFYIQALECIATANPTGCGNETLNSLFIVYGGIENNCLSPSVSGRIQSYFKKDRIYIPQDPPRKAKWVNSETCVWTAPKWMQIKHRLNGVWKYSKLKHLFQVILRIRDSDWRDCLDELKAEKERGSCDVTKTTNVYHRLWRDFEHDTNYDLLRKTFEESTLVLDTSLKTWKPLSSCIWTDDRIRVPGKVLISTMYASLGDFFIRILGVPKPNLETHVQSLKSLAASKPTRSEVKDMIRLISLMDPTVEDLVELNKSLIFPVKLSGGQDKFADKSADFAIVDRLEYGTAFAGMVIVLDFSIEEVRLCRSFLLASGLESRHMSTSVEEQTMVEGGLLSPTLTDSLRLKAYALFRCAVHFNSPKVRNGDRALYMLLRQASVYVSDGITKFLTLVQYGKDITAQKSKANFHLDDSSDELKLYVPIKKRDREVCFLCQLPKRFLGFLNVSDPVAEAVISKIVGTTSLIVVDEVLKNAGIIDVDGVDRPQVIDEEEEDAELEGNESGFQRGNTIRTTNSQPSSSRVFTPDSNEGSNYLTIWNAGQSRSPTRNYRSSDLSLSPEPTLPLYVQLLERLINLASDASFPPCGDAVTHSIYEHRGVAFYQSAFDFVFRSRSTEQHRKLGAAGELYVFELLLGLDIGFTVANWQSTIRKEVCVHDKYRAMQPWFGAETADITFSDTRGEFTHLLINHGYLDQEVWWDQRPNYFIEVKSTIRGCDERFYMSNLQHQRMQAMRLERHEAAPEIYMIMRVFNLEQDNIGLRVYLDPETLRLNGELDFTVETWTVRPSNAAGLV